LTLKVNFASGAASVAVAQAEAEEKAGFKDIL
jgi:hypothetical protein